MIPIGLGSRVQAPVYIFIALVGAGLGTASYFLLATTPIEAGLLALIVALGGALLNERLQRRRTEKRLHKGIEELGKLLSTDAKAGQVLSKRVNDLADLDIGPRLEVIEADVSVLGTVVRQVAEAVSEIESTQAANAPARARTGDEKPRPRIPAIPVETVKRALDAGQLLIHAQPMVTLPQRKLHAYSIVPRLGLDNGRLADPPEFMPVPNGEGQVVIRRIEAICVSEGIKIVRRARLSGDPVRLLIAVTAATLADTAAIGQLTTLLSANRAVTPDLCFAVDFEDWERLERAAASNLKRLVQQGVGLALCNVTTLRLDFAELADDGVKFITVEGQKFLREPARLTDFHSSDISDYVRRFGIGLAMTGLETEEQILALLDDGVKLAQGDIVAPAGPLRADLADDGDDELRQTASR